MRNLWAIKQFYEAITAVRWRPETLQTPGTWLAVFRRAWAVEEIRLMLKGSKTYICAAGMGLTLFAFGMGWIDEATRDTLLTLFGAGGLAALSAKGNRLAKER